MLDATRAVENACFIQEREPGYGDRIVAEILREMCGLADGCTMSGKKDSLVNIGGWIGLPDPQLAAQARNLCVVYEGLHTYGGLAGRDMEAIALGIEESVATTTSGRPHHQVRELGGALEAHGVPIVEPIGGHAVFVDARRFYPHVPQDRFPAQRLAAEIYLDSGTRSMERGIVSAGRDPETGEHRRPALELVRLTIPRRVYTAKHLHAVARSVADVMVRAPETGGLEMVFEPEYLRFFQARFRPPAALTPFDAGRRSGGLQIGDQLHAEASQCVVPIDEPLVRDPGPIERGMEDEVVGFGLEQIDRHDPEPRTRGEPVERRLVVGPVPGLERIRLLAASLGVVPGVEPRRRHGRPERAT